MDFMALAGKLGLQEDEYAELVELFVETSRPQVKKLRDAAKEQDKDGIRKIAHDLNGASGNLGLAEIFRMAKKIEEQGGRGYFDKAAIGAFIEEMETLMQALSEEHC